MAGNTLLRETREGLGTCPSTPKPTCTRVIGSGGSCTRLSKFLIGGVFKSSADDTHCVILFLTLKLLEWIWLGTWKGFSTLRFTHSMLLAWRCLVRKVWCFMAHFRAPSKIWQSPAVARMYSRHPVMHSRNVFRLVKATRPSTHT